MESKFEESIRRYRQIKEEHPIDFAEEDSSIKHLPQYYKKIERDREELNVLKQIINDLPAEILNDYKKNLVDSIDKVFELLNSDKQGLPVSKNQATVISNFVYGKIVEVIKPSIQVRNGIGWSTFYRTTDPKDAFEKERVVNLLTGYKNKILNSEFSNYFQLESLVEELLSEIVQLWSQDDQKVFDS